MYPLMPMVSYHFGAGASAKDALVAKLAINAEIKCQSEGEKPRLISFLTDIKSPLFLSSLMDGLNRYHSSRAE